MVTALDDVTVSCIKCTHGALDFSDTLFAKDRADCYGNALQMACAEGFYCIAQRLILDGADVNDQGGWYGNALQAA
ncbi:ankyrin repeat domain-containing protein [Colletotrichum costaricense]|uniref:Ankyrin repeat domain-containing protein n=1 Tax=Colletotrichum costaricense TaxID=1209916 RepID=A0AAJ0DRZ7_9PEZI|nr:ankyrin repeat domain-containing protein [Colletotrichum costaricense]KAK1503868.1 ankyrin repeat domain-containing protein [Colletotrichum costaricense]